jgi:crotonobetainyl-CoA:carnitine CoA-transferase CaiB-like acyl-CoA transferase
MNVCGDPDRPPVQVSLPQVYIAAGTYAAEGTMVALFKREKSGIGQQVDVSAQATITWFISELLPFYSLLGQDMKRAGGAITRVGGLLCPVVFPCKDGYISFLIQAGLPGAERNQKMVKWLEEEGLATDYLRKKDWVHWDWAEVTAEELTKLIKPVGILFLRYTAAELYDQAIRRGISLFPVSTSKDVLENAQLKARDFWVSLHHEELDATITYPGAFAIMSETPIVVRQRAPSIGEHNYEIYVGELGLSPEELDSLQAIGAV